MLARRLAPLLCTAALVAQGADCTWRPPLGLGPTPAAREHAAACFDDITRTVLMSGGVGEFPALVTWRWDGFLWHESPGGAGVGAALVARDERAGRAILVQSPVTSVWDGTLWQAVGSAPVNMVALFFDPIRAAILGLQEDGSPTLRTWQLSSTWQWSTVATTSGPSSRALPRTATDTARNRVVLLGGSTLDPGTGARVWLNDTWEWNGIAWTRVPAMATPVVRDNAQLVFDRARQRLLLHGCYDPAQSLYLSQTWSFDGLVWTRLLPPQSPPPRRGATLASDAGRSRVVLFGGRSESEGHALLDDTWEWNGATWTQVGTRPSPRTGHALCYDSVRHRIVLFGGFDTREAHVLDDTWEWDGVRWRRAAPAASPPAREGHAMCYDPRRQRVVMFGGASPPAVRGDTWEWDGASWREFVTTRRPSERLQARIVYAGDESLLVGGVTTWPETNEVWGWNGGRWRVYTQSVGPGSRTEHGLAFDTVRRRMVLFGGRRLGVPQPDTWEWDSFLGWIQGPSTNTPTDPMRAACVVVGPGPGGLWRYDGNGWTQELESVGPPEQAPVVFDVNRARFVQLGQGMHEYVARDFNASPAAVGRTLALYVRAADCAGDRFYAFLSSGTAIGIPLRFDPVLGTTSLTLDDDALFRLSATLSLSGTLDATGLGAATLGIPNHPALADLRMFGAALIVGTTGLRRATSEDLIHVLAR